MKNAASEWRPDGYCFSAAEQDLREQLDTLIFAHPKSSWGVVAKLAPGTPIFLFDVKNQTLHGIFEAVSPGMFNLLPLAFGGTEENGSPLPAQVQCRRKKFVYPALPRHSFKKVPGLFYEGSDRVDQVLSEEQVKKISKVFNKHRKKAQGDIDSRPSIDSKKSLTLPGPPAIRASRPASRSRSPKPVSRPRSPKPASRHRSPKPASRHRSPKRASRSRSPKPACRHRSPKPASRHRSPKPASRPPSPIPTSRPQSPKRAHDTGPWDAACDIVLQEKGDRSWEKQVHVKTEPEERPVRREPEERVAGSRDRRDRRSSCGQGDPGEGGHSARVARGDVPVVRGDDGDRKEHEPEEELAPAPPRERGRSALRDAHLSPARARRVPTPPPPPHPDSERDGPSLQQAGAAGEVHRASSRPRGRPSSSSPHRRRSSRREDPPPPHGPESLLPQRAHARDSEHRARGRTYGRPASTVRRTPSPFRPRGTRWGAAPPQDPHITAPPFDERPASPVRRTPSPSRARGTRWGAAPPQDPPATLASSHERPASPVRRAPSPFRPKGSRWGGDRDASQSRSSMVTPERRGAGPPLQSPRPPHNRGGFPEGHALPPAPLRPEGPPVDHRSPHGRPHRPPPLDGRREPHGGHPPRRPFRVFGDTKFRDQFFREDVGTNTTLCFANMPIGLSANHVVDSLDDAGFKGQYDYFKLKPTSQRSTHLSFGYLVVNFTSREAAERAWLSVDRIRRSWPPYKFAHPREPVRWAHLQGLSELLRDFGHKAFHVKGLPGDVEIPEGANTFFELPPQPSEAPSRAEGLEQHAAGANGLEVEQAPGSEAQRDVDPHMTIDPASTEQGQQKRSLEDRQVDANHPAKRPKHSPRPKADHALPQSLPSEPLDPEAEEQRRREDLHRRLNSALGSSKPKAAHKSPGHPKPSKAKSTQPLGSKPPPISPPAVSSAAIKLEYPMTSPGKAHGRDAAPVLTPQRAGRRGGWVPAVKEEPMETAGGVHLMVGTSQSCASEVLNGPGTARRSGPPGFKSEPHEAASVVEGVRGMRGSRGSRGGDMERDVGWSEGVVEGGGGGGHMPLLQVVEDAGSGGNGMEVDGQGSIPHFEYGANYVSL